MGLVRMVMVRVADSTTEFPSTGQGAVIWHAFWGSDIGIGY